jgi:lipopolysaccharide/colanic/teichoic acid biosynthesis glycosyltransferase
MIKRLLDVFVSGIGLIVCSPVFVVVAICIKIDSSGPVFFRQVRVGQFGRLFNILKFRTMYVSSACGNSLITIGLDKRITRFGSVIRKYKIDEIVQLINVLVGEMSLVGPRPEVPYYVDKYPSDIRDIVLSVKPGITDWASIKYKDEAQLLGASNEPESTYIQEVLPIKLRFYTDYVHNRTFMGDIKILLATFFALIK